MSKPVCRPVMHAHQCEKPRGSVLRIWIDKAMQTAQHTHNPGARTPVCLIRVSGGEDTHADTASKFCTSILHMAFQNHRCTGANVWSCIICLDTSDVSSWNSKLNVGPFVSQSVFLLPLCRFTHLSINSFTSLDDSISHVNPLVLHIQTSN